MTNQEIITRALAKGISEVEIYAQNSKNLSISLQNGELENANTGVQFAMSIRGNYQGKMGYVYLETADHNTVEKALDYLIENAKMINKDEKEVIYDGLGEYRNVSPQVADFANYTNGEKIALLKRIDEKARKADPRIVNIAYLQYQENSTTTTIVNSKGLDLTRQFSYLVAIIQLVALENGQTTVGFSYDYGYKFSELDISSVVDKAVDMALGGLGAGSIKSDSYPVVLSRSVATDILEVFTPVFFGDRAMKKLTILADKVGQKVFGDNITIIDNPFDEQALVKIPFDDEGVPCYEKKVVENGVFKGLLHNLSTAAYYQTTSTGNGFKTAGVVANPIGVSGTNLALKGGTLSEEEIIATVQNGVLITSVQGLHSGVNYVSGDFSVQASGFEIVDGKKHRPLTLLVLSGNFYQMLSDVEILGNDLKKNYLNVGSPTLKIGKMSVSGK